MQRYSFSPKTRASVLIGIALFAIMAIGAVLIGLIPHLLVILTILIWYIRYCLRIYDSIVVKESGVTYEPALGQPIVAQWDQIVALVSHSWSRMYDVMDDQGQCLMRISYDLDNFAQLEGRLCEHLRERTPASRTTFTIHSAGINIAVTACCVMLALGLLTFSITGEVDWAIKGGLLSVLAIGWGFYGKVKRVVVMKDGVLVEYLKGKRFIPFTTVQAVSLEDEYITRPWRDLSIERKDQKPFTLQCAREEASMLQRAIDTAWKQTMPSQGAV